MLGPCWDIRTVEERHAMQKLMQVLKREWNMFWWQRARARQKRELELKIPSNRRWHGWERRR